LGAAVRTDPAGSLIVGGISVGGILAGMCGELIVIF